MGSGVPGVGWVTPLAPAFHPDSLGFTQGIRAGFLSYHSHYFLLCTIQLLFPHQDVCKDENRQGLSQDIVCEENRLTNIPKFVGYNTVMSSKTQNLQVF